MAAFRDRFIVPDPALIYLDGNSLGRLPTTTAAFAADLITHQWGAQLIRSWNAAWFTAPERIGAKLARLLGADPDEVIVADSTSINLFKLAVAALRARPGRTRILTDDLMRPVGKSFRRARQAIVPSGAGRPRGMPVRSLPTVEAAVLLAPPTPPDCRLAKGGRSLTNDNEVLNLPWRPAREAPDSGSCSLPRG